MLITLYDATTINRQSLIVSKYALYLYN